MELNITEDDVYEYMEKHLHPYFLSEYMNTRSSAFGNMTPIEFGEEYGWGETLGILRRIWN